MGESNNENKALEKASEKAPKAKEPKKNSFFKGVKAEFAKIIWPNKATVTKETIAVVVASAVVGAIIYVADILFKFGISLISL